MSGLRTGRRPLAPARRRRPLPVIAAGLAGVWLLPLLLLPELLVAGTARAADSPCQPQAVSQSGLTLATLAIEQPTPQAGPAASQCTPPDGATLTGGWNVVIDAAAPLGLQSFSVAIVPADASTPSPAQGAAVTRTYPPALSATTVYKDTIAMAWDTRSLTPYNGVYVVKAAAQAYGGQPAVASVSDLKVNNPPVAPSGVAAAMNGTVPVVTWHANPEPDITGYQVLRAGTTGGFAPVATVATTSFQDTKAPQGSSLSYEVVAVRRSPISADGISSPASYPTGAIVAALPPSPLPPLPTSKPATTKGKGTTGVTTAQGGPAPQGTFSPTLPFNEALPSSTVTSPPDPGETTQTLTAGPDFGGTSSAQKLRFLATGAFLFVLAFVIIRYARKVGRGEE